MTRKAAPRKKATTRQKPLAHKSTPAIKTVSRPVPNRQMAYNSQFFNPNNGENRGKFRSIYNIYYLQASDIALDATERTRLVALSRKLFHITSELSSASKLKASWVVTGGFDPIFKSVNKDYADKYLYPFLKKWYLNCTKGGINKDFKSCLKIGSKMLDRDGDFGVQFLLGTNGSPKINFIEGDSIAGRSLGNQTIETGPYKGNQLRDGIVYDDNDNKIGYQLKGADESKDTIVSASQFLLATDADFYKLDRGLPVIAAALQDGYNLYDYVYYYSQVVKREAECQIINTNIRGQADEGDLVSFDDLDKEPSGGQGTPNKSNGRNDLLMNRDPIEYMGEGNFYLKAGAGEKIESLNTNRPAGEIQQFMTDTRKRLILSTGVTHELLLSLSEIGGASARGMAQIIQRNFDERRTLLEKFARPIILYAVYSAMENGIIPENYTDDLTNLEFSRGPELILDQAYDRDADRKDYILGAKTLDSIARKHGTSAEQIGNELLSEADSIISRAEALQKKHPKLDLQYCIQFLRQSTPNPVAPIMDANAPSEPQPDAKKSGSKPTS